MVHFGWSLNVKRKPKPNGIVQRCYVWRSKTKREREKKKQSAHRQKPKSVENMPKYAKQCGILPLFYPNMQTLFGKIQLASANRMKHARTAKAQSQWYRATRCRWSVPSGAYETDKVLFIFIKFGAFSFLFASSRFSHFSELSPPLAARYFIPWSKWEPSPDLFEGSQVNVFAIYLCKYL